MRGIILDLLDDADYLGGHLIVEFHVALELGAAERAKAFASTRSSIVSPSATASAS
jgi:hypothetical protein